MLSFFSKKKHSSDTPAEEIQGPSDPAQNNGADEFIFVERKGSDDPPRQPQPPQHIYPPMPPAFGIGQYPSGVPYPPRGPIAATTNVSQNPVCYVQDVPFVLAPQLCTKTTHDLTQTQVDGILALLTRQMSVDEQEEYNFALERSVQSECY